MGIAVVVCSCACGTLEGAQNRPPDCRSLCVGARGNVGPVLVSIGDAFSHHDIGLSLTFDGGAL